VRYENGHSTPPVVILYADDIILAEIASGLNLDQLQQDLAGIFQPVHGADRDVDRFVLVHGLHKFVDRYSRSPPHHDPVLGAMVMFLQREPTPGFTTIRLTW
jgi:hypothetical protein